MIAPDCSPQKDKYSDQPDDRSFSLNSGGSMSPANPVNPELRPALGPNSGVFVGAIGSNHVITSGETKTH